MGAALGLLRGVVSLGAKGGGKVLNFAKKTAYSGISNPFKTKVGKAMGLLTVGQGMLGSTGTVNKEVGNITKTTSKYFGNNDGLSYV